MFHAEAIVIGAGISGLVAAYRLHRAGISVLLIEASGRTGGLIHTRHENGYTMEGGPNTFPSTATEMLNLCDSLRLEPKQANCKANKRYLYLNGKLTALPNKPWQALTTPALSLAGKLRALREPFQPKRKADDMSVAGFFAHRLGREVVDNLVDPFISGIYAGNVETLSLPAVFPKLWQWEQESGSLFRAAGQAAKKARRNLPQTPKAPMRLLSFEKGLQTFTDALTQALPHDLFIMGHSIVRISQKAQGYAVQLHTGDSLLAQHVVLAVPAYTAAHLLEGFSPEASQNLAKIPYNGIAVAHLGFDQTQIPHPLDGFGCLIPRQEKITLLGSIWASSLFPERAPEGHVLLSNFIGGAHHPEISGWSAGRIESQVVQDLQQVFHLQGSLEAKFSEVVNYEKAIPQYNLGHLQRIANIETALQRHPNIHLAGNYLKGIALNECVKSGISAAEAITQRQK